MHIVYICREYPPAQRMGGIAAYLKEISTAMVRKGHKVTVISANDDTRVETQEIVDGVNVIRLKGGDFIVPSIEPNPYFIKKFRILYRFRSYRKRIRETLLRLPDVDIVEIAEYGAEGMYLHDIDIPVTIRLHTPTLLDRDSGGIKKLSLHWIHEYLIGKKEFDIMPKFTNITSCSRSLLSWCEKAIPGFPSGGEVIYNPIDTFAWKQEHAGYNENTVFYAGTVAEIKGIGELIEAISILNKQGNNISLKIAGKLGTYGKQLTEHCKQHKYTWCQFLGHISRSELKEYYTKSKVSCFPSWWENLPMVCLEAMAVGNIVIGSDNGGMSEIIRDGIEGYLVSPKSPAALADTIKKALAMNSSEVEVMRKNASDRINRLFSTQVISKQLENYYASVTHHAHG